ncbi:MAG: sigma-70 family RNA polymerase sigma factor [Sodaliphilus sp.]|nr:sigma-70 family RNA polymerase sigma factor [Sodaliphilus sp.]
MDETTFAQKAPALRQKAVAVCLHCGVTHDEAEDLAQDVMLKLWSMRQQLDHYNSIEALVVVMARNLTLSALRKVSRRVESLPECYDTPSRELNAQEQIEYGEFERQVVTIMQNLPPTEHSVLMMRQVEHRSNAEIASLLGMKETSVCSLLARARRKMLASIRLQHI